MISSNPTAAAFLPPRNGIFRVPSAGTEAIPFWRRMVSLFSSSGDVPTTLEGGGSHFRDAAPIRSARTCGLVPIYDFDAYAFR